MVRGEGRVTEGEVIYGIYVGCGVRVPSITPSLYLTDCGAAGANPGPDLVCWC